MIELVKHTRTEIVKAIRTGVPVWRLNRMLDGFDDIRIGEAKDCQHQVVEEEGRDQFRLRGWELIEVDEHDHPICQWLGLPHRTVRVY